MKDDKVYLLSIADSIEQIEAIPRMTKKFMMSHGWCVMHDAELGDYW